MLRNETRNGNDEMNMPAWKYLQIIYYLFSFYAQLPGGGEFLWSFGQRSRLAGRSCAAILHNLVIGIF